MFRKFYERLLSRVVVSPTPVPTNENATINKACTEGFMITYSGLKFFPFKPSLSSINIIDIAHALSNSCRFSGHVRNFYSVAQHCVLASYEVPEEFALEALLHDATEAYLTDMPRPIKVQPQMAAYKELERSLEYAMAERFALPTTMSEPVRKADNLMLCWEAQTFWTPTPDWAKSGIEQYGVKDRPPILPDRPFTAKQKFLERYFELSGQSMRDVQDQIVRHISSQDSPA